MRSDVAVRVEALRKRFPRRAFSVRRRGVAPEEVKASPWVLDSVSFEVRRGETLGVIGPNGAGKSTLLKLIAGVLTPTGGSVATIGRIGAMIELGLGFHPAMTGRENAVCSAMLLGLSRHQARAKVDEIAEFAGLRDVIDHPVREYSTGMVARLGFATATHVQADILLVDEVLAVGDSEFQERCLQWVLGRVQAGACLLLVSHQLPLVWAACDRTILLDGGRVADDGPSGRVIESYLGGRMRPLSEGPSPVELRALALERSVVAPHGRLGLRLSVDVQEPGDGRSIHAALSLPTLDPDLVIVEAEAQHETLGRVGRHEIWGTSTKLPLTGGHLRAVVSVRSQAGEVLARQSADFEMEGPVRSLKPMYAFAASASLERLADSVAAPRLRAAPARHEGPMALRARQVVKSFPVRRRGLGSAANGREAARSQGRTKALDGVDLEIRAGESVGLIGPNGAGKSTLLRCLAGICGVDDGLVERSGAVVPVLELGVGFQPDLDGWENLAVTSALLGLSPSDLDESRDEIVAFSEVGDAMSRPVKQWSTGMRARLGFALASHVPGDVLLIDELLAVGDAAFRRQAIRRVDELRERGVAVVLVSHDLQLVAEVCERVARLESGRVVDEGRATDVIGRYGGSGWSGDRHLGSGPLRVRDAVLAQTRIRRGAAGVVTALIEVDEPSPHVRIEVALRDPSAREHVGELDDETIELYTVGSVTAVDEGGLTRPGRYRLTVDTGPLEGHGEMHVVVTAVDARSGHRLSEAWCTLVIAGGRATEGGLTAAFTFDVRYGLCAPTA